MGETENPHVHAFMISGRVLEPQTKVNIIYLLRPQDTSINSRKIPKLISTYYFWKLKLLEIKNIVGLEKTGTDK